MIKKPAIPDLDDGALLSMQRIYQSLLTINANAKSGKVPAAQIQFDAECGAHVLRWQQIVGDCEKEISNRGLKH